VNFNDPSGHCPFCLVVGGIAIGAYYVGVGFGLTADLVGIAQAEAALGGKGGPTDVAAGLAVQGEFSYGDNVAALVAHGDPFSQQSGFGLAQTNAKEIGALGLSGDPNDPSVAVKVMQARIDNGQRACHGCTARDRVIVAALAQNGGISQSALSRWSESASGGGIKWEDYFQEQFGNSPNAADAQFRENISGIRYPTYFMVLKYARDLLELNQRGWDLPYGVTVEQLRDLEKWAESNGNPSNSR
jgi:hypothetical protein